MTTANRMYVFRATWLYVLLGALGWIYGIYILLYAAGVVDTWISLAPREKCTLDDGLSWRLATISIICGSFFTLRWFATIVVTGEGIAYRWLGTKVMAWHEVTTVCVKHRTSEIILSGPGTRMSLFIDFPLEKIRPLIVDMVRLHSPDCTIEEYHHSGPRDVSPSDRSSKV